MKIPLELMCIGMLHVLAYVVCFPGMACPQHMNMIVGMLKEEVNWSDFVVPEMSEDCLHLNIYTSALTGSRPVMVFIHGGGFSAGELFKQPLQYLDTRSRNVFTVQHTCLSTSVWLQIIKALKVSCYLWHKCDESHP